VKDKSSAKLLSKIKFFLPGTHIMSDAMAFYQSLSQIDVILLCQSGRSIGAHTECENMQSMDEEGHPKLQQH